MTKEIPLTQGKIALVDDEDFEQLSKFKWFAHKGYKNTFYAARNVPGHPRKYTTIHQTLMNPPKGMETDHINGDGLDNRRENLRIVDRRGNQQNRRHQVIKRSNYPGVGWHNRTSKWHSRIRINGKSHSLGYFDDEKAAAQAYIDACKKLIDGGNKNE